MYVLNTDFDNRQACRLHCGDAVIELLVPPCGLEVVEFVDGRFDRLHGTSYAEMTGDG